MTLPKKITARFEIVTPMFLGDAEQEATRIREASIKGALVFWWRALNYSRLVQENRGDLNKALRTMQAREQVLFGGGDHGQSAVLLKVCRKPILQLGKKQEFLTDSNNNGVEGGACYLGYGLMGAFGANAGELERPCFTRGSFKVDLVFRKTVTKVDGKEVDVVRNVVSAVKAFGLLGGLGARNRRGWGSVALSSLEGAGDWVAPTTREGYTLMLKRLMAGATRTQVGRHFHLTTFAKETDIRVGTMQDADALAVLNALGEGFQRYRAWGHMGKVGGKDSEKNFPDDHDWFRKEGRFKNTRGNYVPERVSFGLPHNYSKTFGITANGDFDRRASPLMFHIHKAGIKCFAVALHFPVRFLPKDKVSVWHRKQDNKTPQSFVYSPNVIDDFLNNQRPNKTAPPSWPLLP